MPDPHLVVAEDEPALLRGLCHARVPKKARRIPEESGRQ